MSFGWLSLAGAASVVALAALVRGRLYAIFATVLLTIHTSISVALWPAFAWAWPVYAYLQVAVYVHFASLAWARLRPRPYRLLVSLPASFFVAGTFLAFPWAIAVAFGFEPYGAWVPFVIAALGLVQSVMHRPEEIDITVDGAPVAALRRHPRGSERVERPLRLVQITDPHLGPWQPVHRLQRRVERLLAHDPDLVVLTGDFLTMESASTPGALARALSPLAPVADRCFAVFGNHDHEAPAEVRAGLAANGIRLLVDEEAVLETAAGSVQILGADWVARGHGEHLGALCERFPRRDGHLRLMLLHDPLGFVHVPDGEVDLVLSGHTHGGQLGLVSLGLRWTVLSRTRWPDHGLFAHGTNRLYVHRGTGHYGFPLRVGVPGEASVLEIVA
jgi:predicted MPP superfamily phosphohydrolase